MLPEYVYQQALEQVHVITVYVQVTRVGVSVGFRTSTQVTTVYVQVTRVGV